MESVMRWAPVVEKPSKPGHYYVWSPRLGKCVMGWDGVGWGAQDPTWWLQNDQNPHQGIDGSFDG